MTPERKQALLDAIGDIAAKGSAHAVHVVRTGDQALNESFADFARSLSDFLGLVGEEVAEITGQKEKPW